MPGDRRTWIALLLAVGLVVLSRAPFLLHNPDWGPQLYDAHCFLFSAAQIHADRRAIDPGVPFWVVNPEQLANHYHGGATFMMVAVKALFDITGARSLALVKVLGIAYTAIFALAMTWVLRRFGSSRRRVLWVAPLLILACPPPFFLWVTLFPQGHYFETHAFYAAFLPFAVLAAERRLGPWSLIAAGLLGGLLTAFVVTNALFLITLLVFYVVGRGSSQSLRARLALSAGAAALGAGVFALLANPSMLVMRLEQTQSDIRTGLPSLLAGDFEYAINDLDPWFAWTQHVDLLFGIANRGFVGTELVPLSLALGHAPLALFLCGAIAGAVHAARLVVRPARATQPPLSRFIAFNGLLAATFLLFYLAIGVGVGPASIYNAFYLVPCYTPLIVCIGAFLATTETHRLLVARISGRVLAFLAAGVLAAGWISSYRAMAAPRFWPEDCVCDSRWFDGYFWETREVEDAAWFRPSPREADFDLDDGISRCRRSRTDSEQACIYMGYLLRAHLVGDPLRCDETPPAHQGLCARAVGASRHYCAAMDDLHPDSVGERPCDELEGDLRDACVDGSYHGDHIGDGMFTCVQLFRGLCESLADDAVRSSCSEQIGAFAYHGSAAFPSASPAMPSECESFPEAWQGLCERGVRLAAEGRGAPNAPYCEDVFSERYSRALPAEGVLNYDICLTTSRVDYPWCAIGLARLRGETDCRWRGTPEPFGQAPYVPPQ